MTSDESDAVMLTTKGNVAIITLNKPRKLNAMTRDQFWKVAEYLREVAERDDILFTVLTGRGRFFSAGADVSSRAEAPDPPESRRDIMRGFFVANFETSRAFYTHPKILITALNGPVVGLPAALIAYSDFVYAAPHAYLLTPFTSLGLVSEGGAAKAFVERMGISKANEALLMSRRIECGDLVRTGFVNKVFEVGEGEHERFLELVLREVQERMGPHLVPGSLLKIKNLIRGPDREKQDLTLMAELLGGLDVFEKGIPQREFAKIARGEKRHKL